jgi:amino acid adenylation domain-containing protein
MSGQTISAPSKKSRFSRDRLKQVKANAGIPRLPRDGRPLPASAAQKMFWLLSQGEDASAAYVLQAMLRLHGHVDQDLLARAFQSFSDRHEAVRTSFEMSSDGLVQHIAAVGTPFPLSFERAESIAQRDAQISKAVAAPMDLGHGALVKARLFSVGDHDHILLVLAHHTVADRESLGFMLQEVAAEYSALVAGAHAPAKADALPYADFAAWEQDKIAKTQLAREKQFWQQNLADCPALSTPASNKKRPKVAEFEGQTLAFTLDADVTAKVQAFSRQAGVTDFTTALAAWVILLQSQAHQYDVVTGTPVSLRNLPELRNSFGPLVNSLPLRFDNLFDQSADQLVRQVQSVFLEAQNHQNIQFDQIIEAVNPPRNPSHSPLFQTMFSWAQSDDDGGLKFGDCVATPSSLDGQTAQLDLTLDLVLRGDQIKGEFEFTTALFSSDEVQALSNRYQHILEQLVKREGEEFAYISASLFAKPSCLVGLGQAEDDAPLVHDLIAQQAEALPDQIAVRDGERSIKYAEFEHRADQMAHLLRAEGISVGDRVAICMPRSVEMFIAAQAILKVGACFVPIDFSYPATRKAFIVKDCAAKAVIAGDEDATAFADVPMVRFADCIEAIGLELPAAEVLRDQLAYIIYTSGSTGTPKGVFVRHGALAQMAQNWRREFGFDAHMNVLQMASFGFDVAIADFFRTLCFGGKLVLCPKGTLSEPIGLAGLIKREGINAADFVPAVLDSLTEDTELARDCFSQFRLILCGSDHWPLDHALRLRAICPASCQIVHAYGLTETVVDALYFDVRQVEDGASCLPIGVPIGANAALICGPDLNVLPQGSEGEICIQGECLAGGYWQQNDLTEAKFARQPNGEILFRTGDLGRLNADGQIEFLGRIDQQIKVRGYRIDPSELEHAILGFGAKQVFVCERNGQLVAYVVGQSDMDALASHLRAALPDFMVPAHLVPMDSFPLTTNGKIDRDRLPQPKINQEYAATIGDIEEKLAVIWHEFLGGAPIGRHDNFFERGGHSMLAVRMALKASEILGLKADGTQVFAHPTLAEFAATAQQSDAQAPKLTKRKHVTHMPPSFGQESLWLLAQDVEQNAAYNMPMGWRLSSDVEVAAIKLALTALMERHEALRTSFVSVDGAPQLEIYISAPPLNWREISPTVDQVDAEIAAEIARPFDLQEAPLLRACLIRNQDDQDLLLVTMHHIISDGWSMDIFAREFLELYATFKRGGANVLAPLDLHYSDFVAWQRENLTEEKRAEQADYWAKQLANAPSLLPLPTDYQRPAVQDFRGDSVPVKIEGELLTQLRAFARQNATTVFSVALSAWSYMLAKLSGEKDVVTGVPTANRKPKEVEDIVGFFVNTLALRLDQNEIATPAALIKLASETLQEGQQHADIPFNQIVERLNPARSRSYSPIFQYMLAWENARGMSDETRPSDFVSMPLQLDNAKFDLLLEATEFDDYIAGSLQFATSLFSRQTIQKYAQYFEHILTEFVQQPNAELAQIGLAPKERAMADLERWLQPVSDYDEALRTLPRFKAVCAAHANELAIEKDGRQLSFFELEHCANRLANDLLEAGYSFDQPVGIWADRSIETIISIFAILKAGGAIMPLDPLHPRDRLDFILGDAQAQLILSADAKATKDSIGTNVQVHRVDLQGLSISEAPVDFEDAAPSLLDPAYVLYTSGTTGTPKGVVQSHRTLDNVINWQFTDGITPRRVMQFASLTFDVSMQEIFTSFCAGSSLVLISQDTAKDVANLAGFIAAHKIDRAFLPVAVLHIIAETCVELNEFGGCEFITAGEALKITDAVRQNLPKLGKYALNNHYGPTETHVVTHHRLPLDSISDWPHVSPIGKPIANTNLYILDGVQNPVPDGVVGELYLGGNNVALGYLNRPDLTAERFLDDPFSPREGAKMFKSGDLVRRDEGGVIHYLGRADDQVKIRGFRVEPGEIETALRAHPKVRDCVVLARPRPNGPLALAAYFTGAISVEELRALAKEKLPEYMVPTAWQHLDRMPLNSSGKIDRKALPAPNWQDATADKTPLRTETENVLGKIWSAVLGVNEIGANGDFFALGGHSLLAAKLVFRINQHFEIDLKLSDLMGHSVLEELAGHIDRQANKGTVSTQFTLMPDPENRYAPFPLGDIQQAYLVGRNDEFDLGGVGAHSYNELRIRNFEVERFEAALNKVIARHDMLRAIFTDDGQQQVLTDVPAYKIAIHDISDQGPEAQERALDANRNRLSHQVFDAGQWPLFGFEVTQLSDTICHLHMSLDALILDAASTSIFLYELNRFYADPALDLPEIGVSFRDYVLAEQEFRKSESYRADLDYWLSHYDDMPAGPQLPLVRTPESLKAPEFVRREKAMTRDEWTALKQVANEQQVTPSGLLLAAFCLTLNRYAQSGEFSLSLPLFNRLPVHPEIDRVIGDFTSVLLYRQRAIKDQPFAALAQNIQQDLWRDMDHAKISGIEIMRELGRKYGVQPSGLPIVFNSTLTEMVDGASADAEVKAFDAENVHTITQTPQVWLDHTIMEEQGELIFNWDSIDALFPDGLMDAMFADYCQLLGVLSDGAQWQARTDELFDQKQLDQTAPLTDLTTLNGLFERQAALTPDNVAIIARDRTLTYAEVLREAQALAARLQDYGCAPSDIVGIFLEPSWQQTVAALGILMAGGVYLPLDRNLPAVRLEKILDKTNSRIVLVENGFAEADLLPPHVEAVIVDASVDERKPTPVERDVDDLAYIIFTSGSTGEPKGVMIDHGGACNTIYDINERIGMHKEDRILGVSALNFDLSVYDIFGALSTGAALVVPETDKSRDPQHWLELINAHDVSVWNSVPALLGLLADHANAISAPYSLRVAMMSGDWIPLDLPGKVREQSPETQIWSLGGATEASIWSICYPIETVEPSWKSIPYGKALKGQSFHVLDDQLNARPIWVVGELHIGGRGVALGYYGDQERTDAAFIKHPKTGERLYRTGDLGRMLPDGNIEFMGRADTQVKVQGYRIELGEIEAALDKQVAVDAAAVRIWGDAMDEKRLAAYVVTSDCELTEEALREHLAQLLPAYEIPSSISFIDQMPLSANGKVDRKKLPKPEVKSQSSTARELRPDEQKIVAIVEKALKQSAIAIDANLLALGATSLDIVRISNALAAEMGFRPKLARFMRAPTVSTLFDIWQETRPVEEPVPEHTVAAPRIIEDKAEREAFKAAEKGRRKFGPEANRVPLDIEPQERDVFEANRSVRDFSDAPVDKRTFSKLLAAIMQNPAEGRPRFQYASAGGLYPVQTYIYVKPDRVIGVPSGCYYVDPKDRTLVATGSGKALSADAYDYFVNRPTFEGGAFALFFVADDAAIRPLYGDQGRDMSLIEAGLVAQHLTHRAGQIGLGLCGIGEMINEALCDLFGLGPHHQLIYSMIGGIPATAPAQNDPSEEMEEFEI